MSSGDDRFLLETKLDCGVAFFMRLRLCVGGNRLLFPARDMRSGSDLRSSRAGGTRVKRRCLGGRF